MHVQNHAFKFYQETFSDSLHTTYTVNYLRQTVYKTEICLMWKGFEVLKNDFQQNTV